jgi:hypothetical protein
MEKSPTRKQLEEQVIRSSSNVLAKIDPDNPLWIIEDEIAEFINDWRNLVKHYQWSDDTEISVLIVREYIHLLRVFRLIESDEFDPSSGLSIPPEAKKKAREYIEYLEYFIDEIIKEVERVVNN